MTEYARELIKSSMKYDPYETRNKNIILKSPQLRSLIVYCIQDMGNGKWIPLNRDYKPLGLIDCGFVKYEDYPHLFLNQQEIDFTNLWDNGCSFGRHGWFTYSDGSSPRDFNLYQRYICLASSAFLNKKSKLDFLDFWGYKKEYKGIEKDWSMNYERFCKSKIE